MYLAGSDERVEERAKESNALVELKGFLVFTEVRRQLHTQRVQLADVTFQLGQLVASKLLADSTTSQSLCHYKLFVPWTVGTTCAVYL